MQAENNNIDMKKLPSTPLYPLKNPILTPEQLEQKKKDLIVDLNQKSKELKELGLLDQLGSFVGYQTQNAKEREQQITNLRTQAIDNKIEFKDLPNAIKDDYYKKAETSIFNPLKTKNEIAKEDYQKDLQRKAILNKKSDELTQSDKDLIANDSGFFNNALDFITGASESEKLKEYKEKEKAKDVTKEIQKAYSAFSNIDKNKDFFSLFTSEDKEAQEKAKKDFETIAKNLYHFDGVIYNEKNEPFVIKGDKVYKINDGFIDNFTQSLLNNKFSIAGSVAGGLAGAKHGKSAGVLGLVGGAIAGAALGATTGAATDAMVTNLALDRENKADEIIRHALSEGVLSLATDKIMLGAGKVLKPLAKAPLKLAEMSMPFQFTKNFFTGNAKRASEIIETTLSKEQQEALKEFSAQFGGETKINANNSNDFLREKLKSVFKGDEKKLNAYDKVKEILTLDNHKEQQQAFITAIRSDETGNTLAFLIEAANLSPKANANLKSILNQTTENLTKSLRQFDLKDYEIKSVFDHLEQGTKESYDKALNEIIGKLYDDSYKVNLRESVQDITNFEKFLNDLRAQGEIDPQAKSFLRQIEENVYNPDGVTYEQLKNSRQLINAYLRNVKDPSTLGYIQKASANFLKNDIDNAIDNLLKQNKSAYEKISELQKSAINDYREMKQALELVDKAKIRDKNTQASDAVNSLMKILKAQGQKDLSNYKALTKGLKESDKERLELTILNRLAEESLKQDESLKVFDSAHFFNKLNEFKDEVFSTPKAKEYIEIASGFHKLFKNDAKIAESLKPATTKNLSQGLATTLSGALKYQWTKFTLGTLYRNAPDRILGIKLPKALNEATAGAALKYHIKRALERSHSISDFSKQLELSAKNSQFTNNTLKIIEELNNGIKRASEEIKEATKPSNLVKSIREQDTRPFEVIEDKEAFFKDLNQNLKANATPLPKGMSVEEFKQSLESVENKDRFLEHLKTRNNSDERLALLNLVEPTLREPHIEIFTKDKNSAIEKKEYIKAFKDENNAHLYMLITQDNDTILRTFIPKLNERYMRSHVRDADIIHSFIQPNRTAKSDNALSDVVVYGENTTKKPLTSQEDLSPLEQAQAEKLAKLKHAITPIKEFGTNYPEFALKPKEALEKLLQEKNGQVAGAAYREDLGGIDFVWGTPKTKDSVGYGLAHIIERREEQALNQGLNEAEAKEYALNIVKSIPKVLEKGSKGTDHLGRVFVDYGNIRVGLNNTWNNKDLENHWVISSYELRDTTEKPTHFPTSQAITKEKDLYSLNSVGSNSTTNPLNSQDLSPLELANAEKLAKLKHAITPLKEFGKNYPEFALKPKEALEKLLQEKNGQVAGAAYREDLGGIDFVWGTPKTKDSVGYGLAHIIESREKQYQRLGLTSEQAKVRTNELLKEIPNILQKGFKEEDRPGYTAIILNNSKVILSNFKGNNELKNHYMITSFEVDEKVLRELETIAPLSNDYRDGGSISNLNEPNLTPKPLTSQEDLLKTPKNPINSQDLSPLELAQAEKLAKLKHAITPLKEFGKNYPEFALKPKEALEKLLQEKNGQVAGAAFRDDLGGIDFVWGTPKTKDSNGYGLAHIIEKREKQYQRLGLNAEQIKERTDELVKSIPEVIENGTLLKDDYRRVSVELNNIRVGLQNTWFDNKLDNHFVVTSYERDEKVLRELETLSPLSNDYKGNSNYSALNLNENNLTKESLKSQVPLSP
ncbi:DUF3519 domain-containing protein, partial [Helicobacter pylori]